MERTERKRRDPKPIISMRLPEDTLADLRVIADKELGSVAQVIRRAVAEYLDRQDAA